MPVADSNKTNNRTNVAYHIVCAVLQHQLGGKDGDSTAILDSKQPRHHPDGEGAPGAPSLGCFGVGCHRRRLPRGGGGGGEVRGVEETNT